MKAVAARTEPSAKTLRSTRTDTTPPPRTTPCSITPT